MSIIILSFVIFIFILLIILLFVRRMWAFILSIALLIIMSVFYGINIMFIFLMPRIWIAIIPISGLFTIYLVLCSATRTYFKVKNEKHN